MNNFESMMKLVMFTAQQQNIHSQQVFQSQLFDIKSVVSTLRPIVAMVEQISEVKMAVSAVSQKVDDTQKRVAWMRSALHALFEMTAQYRTENGRKNWQLLQMFFHGEKGYCGWSPVTYNEDGEERDVVVLSIPGPLTRWLICQIPVKSFL